MTRVKKRTGEFQEFDRTKLVKSMQSAGMNEQVAKGIAEKTQVMEGATTLELRKHVTDELRKANEGVADAYARTLRLQAKARDDVQAGAARVPKRIERVPDVRAGQPAHARHGENRVEVRIEPALDTREVWLNRKDLAALGAPEGTRIAVRFLQDEPGASPAPAVPSRQPQPSPSTIPKSS